MLSFFTLPCYFTDQFLLLTLKLVNSIDINESNQLFEEIERYSYQKIDDMEKHWKVVSNPHS